MAIKKTLQFSRTATYYRVQMQLVYLDKLLKGRKRPANTPSERWQSIRSRIDNPNGFHLYSIERVGTDRGVRF